MEFEKLLKQINDKVAGLGVKAALTEENVQKMIVDAMKAQPKSKLRKGAWAPPEVDDEDKDRQGQITNLEKRLIMPAKSDLDREIQKWNDDLYLTATLLKTDPRGLRMFDEFSSSREYTELQKALSTDSGSAAGYEWIPTGFSADVIDLVRLELKVANLFPTITMPTNPFKFPVVASDATGYLQSESISDAATKLRASSPGTTDLTFSAKKLAARSLFSEEIQEDSIVPILPWLKNNVVQAISTAEEKAVINGDASTDHFDTNITAAYDAQKAWDGLRHAVQSAAAVDISTFTIEALRNIRKAMGKYGVDPKKLVWIMGISGYIQALSLKDTGSTQVLTTVDKYGANATILSGELAKLDGSPVIVSEYIYQNLNSSGVYAANSAKTIILCVYIPSFTMGDRRRMTVKTDENIETDQQILVVTERKDFQSFYTVTSEYVVGRGQNLAT